MISIRAANPTDASSIAHVHVETWRTTYGGIVPNDHLANLSAQKRAEHWGRLLQAMPPKEHVFVATDESGRVVGFSNGGANRSTEYPYDGEVMAIYLLKDHQRSGTGRRLFQASINRLFDDGFTKMLVWVLEENPTCGFYAHMGGKVIGEKTEAIGGKVLRELVYGWDNLLALEETRGNS